MVNWILVQLWTKRILYIFSIILLIIAFLLFLPRIFQISLFPSYTNLIWFIILTVAGLLILILLLSNSVIKKFRLKRIILKLLNASLSINDKELASKAHEPLWLVAPIFKKVANKKGILVSVSGTPTYFHQNFIDYFTKLYENYGDLGKISKEFAQKQALNISKEDLDIILDELIYRGNQKIIEQAERWKKEMPKKEEQEKRPSKVVIRRLGDPRRKKRK